MNIVNYFHNMSFRLKGIDDRPRFPLVYKKLEKNFLKQNYKF